jgi:glycosyltransferase involved in cell wall biosynthesis
LHEGFIADNQVPSLFGAADSIVAPFSEVLTSGSIILGLSFGLPVIAPALGCLPELLDQKAGHLYSPRETDGLLKAMKAIRSQNLTEMSAHALRIAASLTWEDIAHKTYQVYQNGRNPI